jgi:hypothetical protein
MIPPEMTPTVPALARATGASPGWLGCARAFWQNPATTMTAKASRRSGEVIVVLIALGPID